MTALRRLPTIGGMMVMTKRETTAICQITTLDGITLHVNAVLIGDNQWELSVQNALGIRSVWTETFISAEAALDAGFEAIKTEGAEAFHDIEGFEYVLDS